MKDYKTLRLMIIKGSVNEAAENLGITPEGVRTKAELRVRQAGIHPQYDTTERSLDVNVMVVGDAFNVSFNRTRDAIWDTPNGGRTHASITAWNQYLIGTHGHSSTFGLSSVDELMDLFLNEYLKANEDGGKQ